MAQWILTVDGAGARVIERRSGNLTLIEEIDHPEGRLHEREINSDAPGRAFDRGSGVGRHAIEPEESPHARVISDFVRSLCARLERGRNEHSFDDLVLVAEPRLLGLLKSSLDKTTLKLVSETIAKDLQHTPVRDLAAAMARAK